MELASSVGALILMAAAAAIIGYSKTALGGLGVVAVAIFATVLPARESTAAILMILIVGDVIACWHYRRDPRLGPHPPPAARRHPRPAARHPLPARGQ